jgi:hypothetical protein
MAIKDRIETCKKQPNCDACPLETTEECICLDCEPQDCKDCRRASQFLAAEGVV